MIVTYLFSFKNMLLRVTYQTLYNIKQTKLYNIKKNFKYVIKINHYKYIILLCSHNIYLLQRNRINLYAYLFASNILNNIKRY